jgi:hypothetical protein
MPLWIQKLLCSVGVHEVLRHESTSAAHNPHSEYIYYCARPGCEWESKPWTEMQSPVKLPPLTRLLRRLPK